GTSVGCDWHACRARRPCSRAGGRDLLCDCSSRDDVPWLPHSGPLHHFYHRLHHLAHLGVIHGFLHAAQDRRVFHRLRARRSYGLHELRIMHHLGHHVSHV